MQDLSPPLGALIGYSSMAATNTVSDETGSMTAPGTPSESSDQAHIQRPDVSAADHVPVNGTADRIREGHPGGGMSWTTLTGNGYTSERG